MSEHEKGSTGNTPEDIHREVEEHLKKSPPVRDGFGAQGEKTPTPQASPTPSSPQDASPPAHTPGVKKAEEMKKTDGPTTGREHVAPTGQSQRPAGVSKPEDSSVASPQAAQDPRSPQLPTP